MKVEFSNNTNFNNKKLITYKAHPDYKRLAKDYNIKASSFFRRGDFYGSPSREFVDVIKILRSIFVKTNLNKKKMLIAGIGDSQESFSLLAVIKNLINDTTLESALDLHIIDLQSKPKDKKLFEQSYFDLSIPPQYARDSFILDEGWKYGLKVNKRFRVKNEILDFLKQTYNDRKKSHWNSRVQDVVKEMNDEQFDIVSINNTLGYIEDKNIVTDTLNNINRIMVKNGVFITDPYRKCDNLRDSMTEEYKGIYRKL